MEIISSSLIISQESLNQRKLRWLIKPLSVRAHKILFITLFFLFGYYSNILAQQNSYKYLEIRANIDILGNITMMPLPSRNDSTYNMIDVKEVNAIINRLKSPIQVLNALSKLGWHLVSTLSIGKDEDGRPNIPLLVYYFKENL